MLKQLFRDIITYIYQIQNLTLHEYEARVFKNFRLPLFHQNYSVFKDEGLAMLDSSDNYTVILLSSNSVMATGLFQNAVSTGSTVKRVIFFVITPETNTRSTPRVIIYLAD